MNIDYKKIDGIFQSAQKNGRSFLLEHEVYEVLQEAGIRIPPFVFIAREQKPLPKDLKNLPPSLVIKVVSPDIIHKTDVGGVRFVENDLDVIVQTCRSMSEKIPARYVEWAAQFQKHTEKDEHMDQAAVRERIEGFLICGAVDFVKVGFGEEILMGLRDTRAFGPVGTMGVGGVDVEFLNARLKPNKALAVGSVHLLDKDHLAGMLEPLAVVEKLTRSSRGREPILSREELFETFFRFLSLGRRYSSLEEKSEFVIEEAEVNPFVISRGKLVPLDGMCRFSQKPRPVKQRPYENLEFLLKPKSIAVIGVSEKMNLGHIILNNILKSGFEREKVYVVKPGMDEIEGCRCFAAAADLPETVDLFVLTLTADQSYGILKELVDHEKARSVILIAGGVGEKEGTQALEENIKKLLERGRHEGKLTPVVNGGNCLGITSKPGRYDTTFIPEYKLFEPSRRTAQCPGLVYISQSGAFMISRMSHLPSIDPLYAVSIGNQIDLTLSDYLQYLKDEDEVEVFAVYIEGFQPGDGLAFARTVEEITRQKGKTVIVYKSGRSPAGRAATSGHTASVAGDYTVCEAVLKAAGAVMTENILEFENCIRGFTALSHKTPKGNRVGLISNAGFECVILADGLGDEGGLVPAGFSPATSQKIIKILEPKGITRLQDVRNPLDVTPVADDAAFTECAEAILEDEGVDCAVISPVPMTPAMQSVAAGKFHREDFMKEGSLAHRLEDLFRRSKKPFVVNIDSGAVYNPLVRFLEEKGVPCFRRSDDAVFFLRKFICRFSE
ncbi:MAG: acetate--CoA ligase family protein [Candidatus Aminicenantes bacterium]|nr:acetate--CoA ligase family protein [Candidatus Aminicenantes bacterium]